MTKIKKIFALAVIFATAMCGLSAQAAVDLNGWHYQGVAKIKGQPIDLWVDMVLDDTDIEFNVSESYKYMAEYTASGTGNNISLKVNVPGSAATTFSSTDGGSTLTGKLPVNGQQTDLWVLKVPSKMTPASAPAEELASTVGSADGYTAFVLISLPQGQKMCSTADFVLNGADGSFSMKCDTPAIQKIFGNMRGSYKVEGSQLVMTDTTGKTVRGTIYDDGYYISVPIGSAQGISLSLVLIR